MGSSEDRISLALASLKSDLVSINLVHNLIQGCCWGFFLIDCCICSFGLRSNTETSYLLFFRWICEVKTSSWWSNWLQLTPPSAPCPVADAGRIFPSTEARASAWSTRLTQRHSPTEGAQTVPATQGNRPSPDTTVNPYRPMEPPLTQAWKVCPILRHFTYSYKAIFFN